MAVFVDTGAWFAYFVRRDPDHPAAVTWMKQNRQPSVTTDYVLTSCSLCYSNCKSKLIPRARPVDCYVLGSPHSVRLHGTSPWHLMTCGNLFGSSQREVPRLKAVASRVIYSLSLLKLRKSHSVATAAGELFWLEQVARLELIRPEDLASAWDVFQRFDDKEWSFTDCTSKVVIERLRISEAFAFDHHFDQFGTVSRVPN